MLSVLFLGMVASVQAAPAPSDAIVVTAPTRASSRQALRAVIRSIGHPADIGDGDFQMARWIEPVCPVVIGVPAEEARALEATIRRVAADAGAPVDGARCGPNIEVVVTSHPRDALLEVQSRDPSFLHGIAKHDVAAMIGSTAAIRWGSVPVPYSADGRPMEADGTLQSAGASRLRAGTETGLGHMIVVVDRDQVASMPAASWRDCVALVALTQFRPGDIPAGPETVLVVANGAQAAPEGLTGFDRAYLKALYESSANLHGSAQQLFVTRRVATLLARDTSR